LVFLQDFLGKMGVGEYCEFDINIVRGLAYYTGTVFEIFARNSQLRALCGGGRYDNLLAGLGGPQIPAIGFGMGDVILEILLAEKKLLGSAENKLDFFVVWDDYNTFEKHGLRLVDKLRIRGFSTAFDYRRTIAMGKQLKQASAANARFAVILGQETIDSDQITIKDMTTGSQVTGPLEEFMDQPDKYM
jgi:histidyl-tRNA synthetase